MINQLNKYSLLFLFTFIHFGIQAQESNYRCKRISTSIETRLDSLTVAPFTIEVEGVDSSGWVFNQQNNSINFLDREKDSVTVCFRVFQFQLDRKYFNRSLEIYDSVSVFRDDIHYKSPFEQREELFSSPGLNKNGSISRGVSFGNSQSVFVNSNLNLQLEGNLTDDIGITAVISDQNVPFQPEGNTQQLQEFDRVYINLYTSKAKLTAGDLVMRNNPSNFLRYLKNGQGAQFEASTGGDSLHTGFSKAGVAISKGKFQTMNVALLEGVQGPYKLRGPTGERFIVVLANSEHVYLDGQLLKRGFNYDYTIDYNLGEVTFTNNVIITKFSRVRVDFEYTDRNYNRTNINASHHQNLGKLDLAFNYYGERDNRNAPVNISLTNSEKLLLSQVGDDLNNALVSGVDTVAYSSNQVLYKSKDTVSNLVTYTIFQQSSDPDSAVYRIIFSDLGEGNGNYIRTASTVNGAVYEWVAPDGTGSPTGRYEPIRVLATPKKKQMFTVGGGYQLTTADKVYGEIAVSDVDQNLFSEIDNADNTGTAVKVGLMNSGKPLKISKDYKWHYDINYEFTEKTFSAIDRFRDVDFDRDWSADPNSIANNNLVNTSVGVYKDLLNNMKYSMVYRSKQGEVNGFQHKVDARKNFGNVAMRYNLFRMNNTNLSGRSDWDRQLLEARYISKHVIPGIVYDQDKNAVQDNNSEVTSTAMNFNRIKFFVKSADSSHVNYNIDYSYREDNDTLGGALALRNITHMANASLDTKIGDLNQLKLLATYRNLKDIRFAAENEETVMGRIDWNSSFLKKHIRTELTFFSATGRELQREFIFINVPMGEGTHNWLGDHNGNGLRDIDEFVLAVNTTDSSNYVKTYVPTDNYIKAFTNNFNYRLNLRAPSSWRREKGIKRVISKVSNISSWNINKKITDDDILKRFLPFGVKLSNNELISIREVLRSTFFYNRSNPKHGMSLGYLSSKQKSLLTGGFDSTGTTEVKWNSRWNIKRSYNFKLEYINRAKGSSSNFLANRNYNLITNRISPELSYQPGNVFRITTSYAYARKYNESGIEAAELNELAVQLRVNQVNKRSISSQLKYIKVQHNQDAAFSSTALGFDMLEGLKKGINWTWQITLQQKLSSGLQISINYEGRKSELTQMIHIGRMQVSALF